MAIVDLDWPCLRRTARGLSIPDLPWGAWGSPKALAPGSRAFPVGFPNAMQWFRPQLASRRQHRHCAADSDRGEVFPGNSGGALVTEDWRLVGLVSNVNSLLAESSRIDRVIEKVTEWGYPVELTVRASSTGRGTKPPVSTPADPKIDTCAMSGLVFDRESNRPLPAVNIGLGSRIPGQRPETLVRNVATTGPDGTFSFECPRGIEPIAFLCTSSCLTAIGAPRRSRTSRCSTRNGVCASTFQPAFPGRWNESRGRRLSQTIASRLIQRGSKLSITRAAAAGTSSPIAGAPVRFCCQTSRATRRAREMLRECFCRLVSPTTARSVVRLRHFISRCAALRLKSQCQASGATASTQPTLRLSNQARQVGCDGRSPNATKSSGRSPSPISNSRRARWRSSGDIGSAPSAVPRGHWCTALVREAVGRVERTRSPGRSPSSSRAWQHWLIAKCLQEFDTSRHDTKRVSAADPRSPPVPAARSRHLPPPRSGHRWETCRLRAGSRTASSTAARKASSR